MKEHEEKLEERTQGFGNNEVTSDYSYNFVSTPIKPNFVSLLKITNC